MKDGFRPPLEGPTPRSRTTPLRIRCEARLPTVGAERQVAWISSAGVKGFGWSMTMPRTLARFSCLRWPELLAPASRLARGRGVGRLAWNIFGRESTKVPRGWQEAPSEHNRSPARDSRASSVDWRGAYAPSRGGRSEFGRAASGWSFPCKGKGILRVRQLRFSLRLPSHTHLRPEATRIGVLLRTPCMRSSVCRAALVRGSLAAAGALLTAAVSLALAAPASASAIQERAYQDLQWRLLGPFRGGWAPLAAGVPRGPPPLLFRA